MYARYLSTALHATAAALALLVFSAPALADIPDPSIRCYDSDAASVLLNPSYVDCSAHYYNAGPAPQTTLISPFAGYGDFEFIGQTKNDNTDSGPFKPFGTDFMFGTLSLRLPQTGTFVIALGALSDYSLYLYDPSKGIGSVTDIAFSTIGVTNIKGGPYQLEYANLYATAVVPEPATWALVLAGLAGIGFVRRPRA